MKPLIGITCGFINEKNGRPDLPDPAFDYLKAQYCERIVEAGGIPVIIPNLPEDEIDESILAGLIGKLDGIVFSGGRDLDPSYFGDTEIHPSTLYVPERDARRDYFEIALAKYAVHNTGIPIFGICRGHQALNVALDGSLWQDISQFHAQGVPVILEHRRIPDSPVSRKRVWHTVQVDDGSLLRKILGASIVIVNSSHHQFVREIGTGLNVVARAPDGAIEGLELPGDRFLLTVQWHPEAIYDKYSARLFEYFVQATMKSYTKE